MTDFLTQAIDESLRRVTRWKQENLLQRLREVAAERLPRTNFADAVRNASPLAIITEIKRASPSKGVLNESLRPATQARNYATAGAAAISVLTESQWFRGSLEDLRLAARAVDLPILRKDFVVDPYDLEVTRATGASAVLLIVAALSKPHLGALLHTCHDLQLSALVEVHTSKELDAALDVGATIIGVNARNLRTLEVDVPAALGLLDAVPTNRFRVFESGIKNLDDVQAAMDHGADAILVGETLVRSANPGLLIQTWKQSLRFPANQGESP